MRVIAGDKRRMVLYSPRNDRIRPTGDKIKETLFNMIGYKVEGAVFWDLFSGTGQIGIEALSRGAAFCEFFDTERDALALIEENLKHTKLYENGRIIRGSLPMTISKGREVPDIIFMDPPYDKGFYLPVFKELASMELSEDVLIIAESDLKEDFSFLEELGFTAQKEKLYKSSKHVFIGKR